MLEDGSCAAPALRVWERGEQRKLPDREGIVLRAGNPEGFGGIGSAPSASEMGLGWLSLCPSPVLFAL